MLQLHFHSISEKKPGDKWQKLFNTHWSAYKSWFQSKGAAHHPPLDTCQKKLKEFMPEMADTYDKLCELAGNDKIAHRFLTGWKPPAYITGCSQVVWTDPPQLVRNYDYHPHLSEGTVLHSAWNGKKVMGTGDCLAGLVDGINEDGLVVSLTFGGRKVVGEGFGIPFIIRYVLEFASNVDEAVEILQRVPSHQAYNVAVLDNSGKFRTVQMAPDKRVKVTEQPVSTNHQGEPDWPEHALFSKTVERKAHLEEALRESGQTAEGVADEFLKKPLFNTRYQEGFGTVYTAVYRPQDGTMELRWQDQNLKQSFEDFREGKTEVRYDEKTAAPSYASPEYKPADREATDTAKYWTDYGEAWASGNPAQLAQSVAKTIAGAMGMANDDTMQKLVDKMTAETKKRGQVPWEMLADLWAGSGSGAR